MFSETVEYLSENLYEFNAKLVRHCKRKAYNFGVLKTISPKDALEARVITVQ